MSSHIKCEILRFSVPDWLFWVTKSTLLADSTDRSVYAQVRICQLSVENGRMVDDEEYVFRISVDIYDAANDTWSTCCSMEARRSTLGVAVLNGCIFAVGGFDGSTGLASGSFSFSFED